MIEHDDFREEANKKYKRLVLGKEVRLRGAYVIKAERIEKMQKATLRLSSVLTTMKHSVRTLQMAVK